MNDPRMRQALVDALDWAKGPDDRVLVKVYATRSWGAGRLVDTVELTPAAVRELIASDPTATASHNPPDPA